MPDFTGYPADTLKFLRALKRNNQRDWFKERKDRYESSIVDPSLALIADMAPLLKRISPQFRAIPRKTGGSMMRIYRDTRFAKDKSPYKTNVGIHFRHEMGGDVHAPGFYLHIEPKNVFVGAGIWRPEPKVAKVIREGIVDDPAAWKRATRSRGFSGEFSFAGESLKRPPRGFDPEHPLVEDLMRKDFIAVHEFAETAITSATFTKDISSLFGRCKSLMKFLCGALELPF